MRKFAGISLFVLAVLVLVIGTLSQWIISLEYMPNYAAQEEYWDKQNADVQEHIKAWEEQKITKYQLTMHLSYTSECERKVTIENNAVTQTFKDTCKSSAYTKLKTIDDLFALINAVAKAKSCGTNGCDCDGPTVMDVVYDKQYKFPQTAKPVSHREETWRFKKAKVFPFVEDFMIGRKFCTLLGEFGIGWAIYSFTLLQ